MTNDVGLLEQLKQQHAAFVQKSAEVQVQFQQLQGAIFACESMIKQHEEKLKAELEALANKLDDEILKENNME